MTNIMVAGVVGLLLSALLTPVAIRTFRRWGWGQLIREEGPRAHYEKRGTPTMGGIVILLAMVIGYLVGHIGRTQLSPITDTGLLAMGTIAALGALGFLDDFIKIKKSRSLGLQKRTKILGQLVIGLLFAILAVAVTDIGTNLSIFRPTALDFGLFFFVWIFVIIAASSNGVNLTDGLDGLAVGSSAQVFAAFVIIGFWIFRNPGFYDIVAAGSDPFDLAILAAALFGSCTGFLWWNTDRKSVV